MLGPQVHALPGSSPDDVTRATFSPRGWQICGTEGPFTGCPLRHRDRVAEQDLVGSASAGYRLADRQINESGNRCLMF